MTSDNQNNSDWTGKAQMWAYNQGIDGEMINWIWEKAGSKAEFYDLCHKQLNCRPVCNYTEEMKEIICSIFD